MSLENTSGRKVRSNYGPRKVETSQLDPYTSNVSNKLHRVPFRVNQFVNILPTLRAKPYNRDSSATFTGSSITGTLAVDVDRTDHTTGLPMAKITIPAGNTSNQTIQYWDIPGWSMGQKDVYLFSVYFPDDPPPNFVIQALVSDTSSIAGVNFRTYTWQNSHGVFQRGYNTFAVLQSETYVGNTTFKLVGTTINTPWVNSGGTTEETQPRSINFRCRHTVASGTDTVVYLGAIHSAPEGWCKSAICWAADDVPISFYNLAVPIIEDFGWKCTLNAASAYAGDPQGQYISTEQYKELISRGHEVWGHTRLHDNLDTSTIEQKTTSLSAARDFWNSHGIHSAARFMAYPFGAYDTETIGLLPTLGYKLAATITGQTNCAWTPAINPYTISRFTSERSNSWQVDTMIYGSILRGQMLSFYQHNAVEGGSTTDTYPGSTSFYTDHLRRWCELVKFYEEQNKVVCLTNTEYYQHCGVDPYVDEFTD